MDVPPVTAADLALPPASEGTAEAAARVARARDVQIERGSGALNSRLDGDHLQAAATPDAPGQALLTRAAEATRLTARGWTRTLRLARTIADLDGSDGVRRLHIAEALIYRRSAMEGAIPSLSVRSLAPTG